MKKIFLFFTIITALFEFACKKNDGGPPMISDVRVVDTTKRDSLFTQAIPGTLIVIQGSNLGELQAVFFNDTSAYFNPLYSTNSNIIVTIPASAQTAATLPNVPNKLRFITNHSHTTHSFS